MNHSNLYSVDVATTQPLPSIFSNDFTLTNNSTTLVDLIVDGITLNVNDTVLVKDQINPTQNGPYKVIQIHNSSKPFILQRIFIQNFNNQTTFIIKGGNTLSQNIWIHDATVPKNITLGVTELQYILLVNIDVSGMLPTTTKGDIIVHDDTENIRLPVGTDDQIIIANSNEDTGLEWVNVSNILPTTTKGDIIVHDDIENIRLPVGTDDQIIIANSNEDTGLEWVDVSNILPNDIVFEQGVQTISDKTIDASNTISDGALSDIATGVDIARNCWRRSRSTNQDILQDTWTGVNLNNTIHDLGNNTQLGIYSCPFTGMYTITASVRWEGRMGDERQMRIIRNNDTVAEIRKFPEINIDITTEISSGPIICNQGDGLFFQVRHTTGSLLNIIGDNNQSFMSVQAIGRIN
jgi:hypothetical protein